MWVRGEYRSTLNEAVVSSCRVRMRSGNSVVESGEDARRPLLFNEVAHNLVIEVLDGRPLDLLPNVLFLLGLESKFNEDLLQLLVDVVDAELFE